MKDSIVSVAGHKTEDIMRYFIELAYKGSAYCGWQFQTNAPSVQQTLQEAMSVLLRSEHTTVVGAGRTDTGVHAAHYIAHFAVDGGIEDVVNFIFKLNYILPEDIAVYSIRPVRKSAHARFDATKREYQYRILPYKDPFRRDITWQYYVPLDHTLMNQACEVLLGEHNFTTFSKLNSDNRTDLCTVSHAHWELLERGELLFTIRSNRYLRNMIRSLVYSLVDVGRGKITVERFNHIFLEQDRSLTLGSAPARGLSMTAIEYPDSVFIHDDETEIL